MKRLGNDRAGLMSTGRRSHTRFERLVSPLGENGQEDNCYSPADTVNGARQYSKGNGQVVRESARDYDADDPPESRRARMRGEQG